MVKFTTAQAEWYRRLIQQSAENLPDNDAAHAPMLFERWIAGVEYGAGKRVCYGDKLYKVLQTHTSQASWSPDVSPSLFAEVLIPDPTVILDWVQPESTNPYMIGDKVRHNDKVWISVIDNNVWEPGVYGWDEMV